MSIDPALLQELSRICLEQATESLAKKADEFSRTLPKDVDGRTALTAFSAAIRSTNAKVWPSKGAA